MAGDFLKRYSIKVNEKISVSEIKDRSLFFYAGEEIDGRVFTPEDYMKIENAYVKGLKLILKYMKIDTLRLKTDDIPRHKGDFPPGTESIYSKAMLKTYNTIRSGDINLRRFEHMVRLCLREDILGEMFVPFRFKITSLFDFEVGIKSSISLDCLSGRLEKLGLYLYNEETSERILPQKSSKKH